MEQSDTEIFLSTPSARRATLLCGLLLALGTISIHALREEGDLSASGRGTVPRKFLSTPSARRATATVKDLALELVISIHALRKEGDAVWTA